MTLETEKLLDSTGWQLLQALQQDARLSYTQLGQRVGLSAHGQLTTSMVLSAPVMRRVVMPVTDDIRELSQTQIIP